MTLGEDLRKPAYYHISSILHLIVTVTHHTHIEIGTLNILEVDSYRVRPRLKMVDIADTVRGQVRLAVLELGELELAAST